MPSDCVAVMLLQISCFCQTSYMSQSVERWAYKWKCVHLNQVQNNDFDRVKGSSSSAPSCCSLSKHFMHYSSNRDFVCVSLRQLTALKEIFLRQSVNICAELRHICCVTQEQASSCNTSAHVTQTNDRMWQEGRWRCHRLQTLNTLRNISQIWFMSCQPSNDINFMSAML